MNAQVFARRATTLTTEVTQLDRLRVLLEDWSSWSRGYSGQCKGFPSRSISLSCMPSSQSFDDMADDADHQKMQTVDAAIDSLPPAQRAAVCREYGQASVWRFPRNNFAQLLDDAHAKLFVLLRRRGVTL